MQEFASRVDEAVVLVRAVPLAARRPGEAVGIVALDLYQTWLTLAPVSFRTPEEEQRFARWDRLRFRCRPSGTPSEMPGETDTSVRRVDPKSIEIAGQLRAPERAAFLARSIVPGLRGEAEAGRGLALLRPEVLDFRAERLSAADLLRKSAAFERLREQLDLIGQVHLLPPEPCPYEFRYRLRDADGERTVACEDWEMDAAFSRWRRQSGEKAALDEMARRYGEDYPAAGMALVMGASPAEPEAWRVLGVVALDEVAQPTLF